MFTNHSTRRSSNAERPPGEGSSSLTNLMVRKTLTMKPLVEAMPEVKWRAPPTPDEAHLCAKEQNRSAATIVHEVETATGRAVSRAEAIRVAHGILKRAEGERLTLAENEARRGIQWEDE